MLIDYIDNVFKILADTMYRNQPTMDTLQKASSMHPFVPDRIKNRPSP